MPYSPPFELTHAMMHQVAEISTLIGHWQASNPQSVPNLRRENRIRTIQASLAVEQNTLSLEQVTAVIGGKNVLGSPKEIQEVHNAFAAYESMSDYHSSNGDHLLNAHGLMMKGLISNAGQWRNGGAGIYRGEQLVHMAPPANQVPRLMIQLLNWLETTDAHPLIVSAAFHYEFEFIHPFSDSNGRMGRFWQTLILSEWQPLLAYLPVEAVIKTRQDDYYQTLRKADATSDCTLFIEFLLMAIHDSLREAIAAEKTQVENQVKTRVKTPDRILLLMQQHPDYSMADMANTLELSVSTVERAVSKLKQAQRVQYIGPKKGGYWQVIDPT